MNHRICIVGGGVGGLTAGALLSKMGYEVSIFERESILGGRALSLDCGTQTLAEYLAYLRRFDTYIPFSQPSLEHIFDNRMLHSYTIDLGFHLLGGGSKSSVGRVLSALGREVEFSSSNLGYVSEDGGVCFPFLSFTDKIRMLPRILQLVSARPSTIASLGKVPIAETMREYGKGKMKLTLELFPRLIATVNDLSRISTGETLSALGSLVRSREPTGYPKGGLRSISERFADAIKAYGGELNLQREVGKVVVEEGAAKGVAVEGEIREFDSVILDIPARHLFSVLSRRDFPSEWVGKIEGLGGTGSLCAYLSFKGIERRLIGKTFMFIEREVDVEGESAAGMIDFQVANPEMGLSPKNRHLVQAYVICSPEEAKSRSKLDMLRDVLDKWLERLMPDFKHDMLWAIYPATSYLDAVAKTTDNEKPNSETPVKGLYLVGDSVKSTGIGINCAVNSSINLVNGVFTKAHI